MEIISNNMDDLYIKAFQHVMDKGAVEGSRAGTTKEVLGAHFVLTDPTRRIVYNPIRKLSLKFMLGEFLWIMSGREDLEMVSYYNKRMGEFSDDGIILHGAYGKRLREWRGLDQIGAIIKKLEASPNTRQAIMMIFDPAKDHRPTKDVPCNNVLQFLLRDGKLHMFVYVRSNDLYLGLPYDIFHWTLLQEMIAFTIKASVGAYHHFVGSAHIYQENWERGQQIAASDFVSDERMPAVDIEFWELAKLFHIEEALRQDREVPNFALTPFEYWIANGIIRKKDAK